LALFFRSILLISPEKREIGFVFHKRVHPNHPSGAGRTCALATVGKEPAPFSYVQGKLWSEVERDLCFTDHDHAPF